MSIIIEEQTLVVHLCRFGDFEVRSARLPWTSRWDKQMGQAGTMSESRSMFAETTSRQSHDMQHMRHNRAAVAKKQCFCHLS